MNEVNLYDVYTLKDGKRYAVIDKTMFDNKKYLLLGEFLDNEEINDKNIKIVELLNKDGKNVIRSISDNYLVKELGDYFSKNLENM